MLLPTAQAEELSGAVGVDKLQTAAGAYLDGYLNVSSLTGSDFGSGAKAILDAQTKTLPGILRGVGRSGALLLTVALLCALPLVELVFQTLGALL